MRQPEVERPIERPRRRWVDCIGSDLEEIGYRGVDCIAQDSNKWRAAVNTVIILRVL
jgi:hypothetical protein